MDSQDKICWIGPQNINILTLSRPFAKDINQLKNDFKSLREQFYFEFIEREKMMIFGIFGSVETFSMDGFNMLIESWKLVGQPKDASSSSLEYGLAKLVGRKRYFLIKQKTSILGRPATSDSKISWQVDLPISDNDKISKQHLIINWNFQKRCFEIKCLSKKYPICLNGDYLNEKDPARAISEGDLIGVGGEAFYFQC